MVTDADLPSPLSDDEIRRLVFETFGQPRFTQDSPFMPEVWTEFIKAEERRARARIVSNGSLKPSEGVDLLITPWRSIATGEVAQKLKERVRFWSPDALKDAAIAPGWTHVVAKLDFQDAAQSILPMCGWWLDLPKRVRSVQGVRQLLTQATTWSNDLEEIVETGGGWEQLRFMALAGFVMHLRLQVTNVQGLTSLPALVKNLSKPLYSGTPAAVDDAQQAFSTVASAYKALVIEITEEIPGAAAQSDGTQKAYVFSVNLNRSAHTAIFESRGTIKADAAQNLFRIATDGIAWAVIDSGIDATHPAFRNRMSSAAPDPLTGVVLGSTPLHASARSRIRRTYDFTNLRRLLATAELEPNPTGWPTDSDVTRMKANPQVIASLKKLKARSQDPRDLDWALLDPLICIPHTSEYSRPNGDHGTHVAGILAADWPKSESKLTENFVGMCPDIHLFDLRVFDFQGNGDEFAIMAALSFVGWLNRDRANPAVHGVNLSLALTHHVDAFACGRTPVCDVCNELVGSGTVVVAAAGNTGFEAQSAKQSRGTGYRSISITDPGNAEGVITVGSVHKSHPHAYGVSYFSGRGPTGDGRRKPDLVAPGEKIESTVSDKGTRRLDGTSMAAPHVSGAAALLMSRHRELVGAPRRVKEILMKTATDLGREGYFQGAGLVDVLRALQFV